MIILDENKFWMSKQGYYVGNVGGCIKRLHVYVYEKHYGKIEKGFYVHHKDHNKSNNDIDNLELIRASGHQSYHGSLGDITKLRENLDKYRHLASIWHGSSNGIDWHKQHYENMKHKLHERYTKNCLVCGKVFETDKKGKFCSNNCKSKNRFNTKASHVHKTCAMCGVDRFVNKSSKAMYCVACSPIVASETKRLKRENKKNNKD